MIHEMTCEQFIRLLASEEPANVTDITASDSGYEFELTMKSSRNGEWWEIIDSDTDDIIIIKDPENMETNY